MKAKFLIWPLLALLVAGHFWLPAKLAAEQLIPLIVLLWGVRFVFRLIRFLAPLILMAVIVMWLSRGSVIV